MSKEKSKKVEYIALKDGFADKLVKKGESFFYSGPKGKWMKEVDEKKQHSEAKPEVKAEKIEESKDVI